MRPFGALLAVLALLAWASPARADAGQEAIEDARIAALDDGVLLRHLAATGTPGAIVSIVRDGRLVHAAGHGLADAQTRRPMARDTEVRIGSITKTFTWTLAMMEVEAGRLDLDADLNRYLRSYTIPEGPGGPISMRHLMAHRGGFEDSFGVFTHSDRAAMTLAEAIARDAPARVMAAGSRTSYSNWGTSLAALVLSDISGQPTGERIRDRILGPLGMASSSLESPAAMAEARRARLATPHRLEGGRAVPLAWMQLGPHAPSGGLSSTADDMARWMRFHLAGGALDGARLLGPETHARMLTRPFPDRAPAPDLLHGFIGREVGGMPAYGHGGTTEGFQSSMLLVPALGLGVFVSANAVVPGPPLADQIAAGVVRMRRPASPEAPPRAFDPADYASTYLNNRRSFTRFEKILGGLGAAVTVASGDAGTLRVAGLPTGEAVFRATDHPDLFADDHGAMLAFVREGNRVTHLVEPMGVMSFERIGWWQTPQAFNAALGLAMLLSVSSLLAIWKRSGAPARGDVPRWLALGPPLAALLMLGLAGALVALTALAGGGDFWSRLPSWPLPEVQAIRAGAHLVALAAVLGLFALVPLWRRPLAHLGRRIHVTLLVAALAFFTAQMAVWNLILAPVS
jgi:CubicO group peptidase (beta-lactamase class C family)